jgi:4-hydroxy-4-methyl-2-oxoglutarate aldolase
MTISDDTMRRAATLPTATLHEAFGKRGNLPSAIKPVSADFKLCGRAVTVHVPGGDNVWIHRAIYEARPGDVLVVCTNSTYEHGYWGEIMSTAALERGLAGVVIDGGARDGKLLTEFGFPVFSRGLCIKGTGKDLDAVAWINKPVMIGEVVVSAGDLIVGDGDGVVAIPQAKVAEVLVAAERREGDEAQILERLKAGESTLAIYGWN